MIMSATVGGVKQVLGRLGIEVPNETAEAVITYTEILLKWNQRINLTGIREPEEIWRRHFGESFFLAQLAGLSRGRLVDIGSGAGFPGLAVKLRCPLLEVVLLEPASKKAAFLREVTGQLHMSGVVVLRQRWQEWRKEIRSGGFNFITLRAVGDQEKIVEGARAVLNPGGKILLLLGTEDAQRVIASNSSYEWRTECIPGTLRSVALIGSLR